MTFWPTGVVSSAEGLKSFERFNRAWIEEARTLSERSFELLRPTIRAEGSEIWASWNPRRKDDAVDKFFRGEDVPSDAVCVKANWRDNPWFPQVRTKAALAMSPLIRCFPFAPSGI
jgi:phage terminase large subunit